MHSTNTSDKGNKTVYASVGGDNHSILSTQFNLLNTGIAAITLQGIIADVNPAFCTITGLQKNELTGNSIGVLFPAQLKTGFLQQVLPGPESFTGQAIAYVTLVLKPYSLLNIEAAISMLHHTDGSQYYFVAIKPIEQENVPQYHLLEQATTEIEKARSHREKTKKDSVKGFVGPAVTQHSDLLNASSGTLPTVVSTIVKDKDRTTSDIINDKQAQVILSKALADKQRILDYSLDIICAIDLEGNFVQVSKASKDIWGYHPEELTGISLLKMVLEEDRDKTVEMVKSISQKGVVTKNFENRHVAKDGRIVHMIWSARWDDTDKTMYCIARDATEKKEQELALGLSEKRYQYLFNNNPLPLFIFEFLTGQFIEVNDSATKKYGYTKEEFLSKNIKDIRPKTEVALLEDILINEKAYSHVSDRLWLHTNKNGDDMLMNVTGNIIDYKGRRCVLTLVEDVTGKVKAEQSIRSSEEKRKLIMNAALDAIVCMDTSGKITFWNPQAEKIFGWKETEVTGQVLSSVIIPLPYREMHNKGMEKYLATGQGPALNTLLKLSALRKDGTTFPIELTILPIKQDGEEFFCSFVRDITEQKKAETQKEFERRDKEALINSTDDMIWSISKDFTLLAANHSFLTSMETQTGKHLKLGDNLLMDGSFTTPVISAWQQMYLKALSGIAYKKEVSSIDPVSGNQGWYEISFNPIYDGDSITGIACYSRNTTELRLSTNKLLAINKKLETAQQMAALGYWEIDLQDKSSYWSDELFNIFGFKKSEERVPFQQIIDCIFPDDKKAAIENFRLAMKGEQLLNYEHRILLKNGAVKVLLQKGNLIFNDMGKAIALEGTCQDITFRKIAEQAVQNSEEKYRMIFNSNPLPNWIYDLDTLNILEVNNAAIAHYGYSASEFAGMNIKNLFVPQEHEGIALINKKINSYGIFNFGQWQHIKKSGQKINVDITGHAIYYDNRNAVMIVCNDITEIIQTQQALAKSIERFEYATKATSDAIWDCDLINDTMFWGEGFNTLFGYRLKEKEPGTVSWTKYIHPDDLDRVLKSLKAVINNPQKNYWQNEYRFKKFDGSYVTVTDCAMIVRDNNGMPYRVIGAMQDITERLKNELVLKELNEQLNKRAKELASSNQELEQFAYIASHDLQEPLRMVSSFLNQIQKKYDPLLDEPGKKYIKFAVDGATRMRQIILDLLEYSKVGKQQFDYEKIATNALVHEVINLYSTLLQDKKAVINCDALPDITAAKMPVQQVFQNLISNALKYHSPNITPQISISGEEQENCWLFKIADNGIGIDTAFFSKIFVIFQRLHNKDEYSGTGIGLAICKKIIDLHKGKLWVESAPEKGSTFYFTISKFL